MAISKTSMCQAKVALHEAGKLSRRLNTEMKRYQAALDKGGNAGLLLDAMDEIMDTVDRLKDTWWKLSQTAAWERENNPESRGEL